MGSNKNGNFTFISNEKLKDGVYNLWAEVTNEKGAKSDLTEKETFIVRQSTILQIGDQMITVLTVIVPLIALVVLLLVIIWYGWYKIPLFKKNSLKESREAERTLRQAFDILKKDVRNQIKLLKKAKNKGKLTKKEIKAIKTLKKDLSNAEKFVKKEIKDIQKTIK